MVPPVDESPSPAAGHEAAQPALRVLVAEDTPAHRQLLVRMLERHGHAVTLAENGREAVEAFAPGRFDVVLMDVQMPLLDGCQATEKIRQLEGADGSRTPIMGLTAQPTPELVERCLQSGMNVCVAKPLDTALLMQLLQMDTLPPVEPASPTKAGSVLDLEGTLRRLGGDLELLKDFVEIFDKDRVRLLDAVQAAVQAGDAKATERSAHALRGLMANLGAQPAVQAATQLEHAARDGRLDGNAAMLAQLEHELTRLDEALNELRRS